MAMIFDKSANVMAKRPLVKWRLVNITGLNVHIELQLIYRVFVSR